MQPPITSLPKGGGAVRSIGEKFANNPVTGTGTFVIPLPVSPGRSGFGPQLSLTYDSGAGNGPFGLGWQLAIPSITRKTDKGLPRYQDAEDSDTFLLSGADDLVPVLEHHEDRWVRYRRTETAGGVTYQVDRYRPRLEARFSRIERWQVIATGETHWRSISGDNITSVYGKTGESRIADPTDPRRVFSWLVCESYDDRGNAIRFSYKAEDEAGVNPSHAHERSRTPAMRSAQRYCKRILYGNRLPYALDEDLSGREDWMFEVVFDYGEHYQGDDSGGVAAVSIDSDLAPWALRHDSFSTRRPGFEVRTSRLCRRMLMCHHFPEELGTDDYLVRAIHFAYRESATLSVLEQVVQSGYVRHPDGTYVTRSMPALELDYSRAALHHSIQRASASTIENFPAGFQPDRHEWVDLDAEGVPGLLERVPAAWYYRRNLGGGRLASASAVALTPAAGADAVRTQFIDLAGDGQVDLAQFGPPLNGFYERTADAAWTGLTPFPAAPTLAWHDPNVRFVDLDGDGHADLLITEQDVFHWHQSLGEQGFGPREMVSWAEDEDNGPRLVFADGTSSVYVADMSGDGLPDLVRVRNGAACYWPNLGYGRFGARIDMDNAPTFDAPEGFDQRRIRLADVDGTGVADILYIGVDGIQVYFNAAGNGWTAGETLPIHPEPDDVAAVTVIDFLGSGTACLVWPAAGPDGALRYVDLMGGHKPHLLVGCRNNLGAETRIQYASSTTFYLADLQAGRPWITRLPFPVHTVERVETLDHISGNRFVTRYAYHHGYFDGVEREFRGFGMVEQWDTEAIADVVGDVAPVLTRTWYHTGAHAEGRALSEHYQRRYFRDPALSTDDWVAQLLPDAVMPPGLSSSEEREATRALKGAMLRREIYGLDESPASAIPYVVNEHATSVRVLQPHGPNRHAVFLTHASEALTCHYERDASHPRIGHEFVLAVDDYGHVLESAKIAYGRREPSPALEPAEQAMQARTWATYTVHDYTNAIDLARAYRTPMPWQTRTYELTGITAAGNVVSSAEVSSHAASSENLSFDATPDGTRQKRLIEHTRTRYRRDDLTGPLPFGTIESRALSLQSFALALTPALVSTLYGGRVTDAMLTDGGYVHAAADGDWWVPTAQVRYSPSGEEAEEATFAARHFFLPHRFLDAFGQVTTVRYDAHDLLVLTTTDAVGNETSAGERDADGTILNRNDYRVLAPALTTDPNRNRSAVAFDALGMVVATAVMGKQDEQFGDRLEALTVDLDDATIAAVFAEPAAVGAELLGGATSRLVYDMFAYQRSRGDSRPQPVAVYTVVRETHDADLQAGASSRIHHTFSYSDGFGRQVQKKAQAEAARWAGSGWTVYNNKGLAIRTYEPFFSVTHEFEFAHSEGVSITRFYDPMGRAVATLYPNHTYSKVVFDAWTHTKWDVNDTVAIADPRDDADVGAFFARVPEAEYLPTWHAARAEGARGAAEQDAAEKAAAHASTPLVAHVDALGRTCVTVAHQGAVGSLRTTTVLDVEGNECATIDALGRTIVVAAYDMAGRSARHAAMDAGTNWTLVDVGGSPTYSWNSRGRRFRHIHDAARRPVERWVSTAGGAERLNERLVYGEAAGDSLNHRGRLFQRCDAAGVLTHDAYDFKGNILRERRQLTTGYKTATDWAVPVELQPETFTTATRYDALNRVVAVQHPEGTTIGFSYNEANLLGRVEGSVRGAPATVFADKLDYNARGQRTAIAYGNGVVSTLEYDAHTFRLARVTSRRGGDLLQDLRYAFDPAGNVTSIRDAAQQTVYFANAVVEPHASYTYDALYRLTEATGREHAGQLAVLQSDWRDGGRVMLTHPHNGQAMRRYRERYEYDAAGNLLRLVHQAANADWTRSYRYDDPSALDADRRTNRLTSTSIGEADEAYTHDAGGNVTSLPHLPLMQWDDSSQLHATSAQVVNDDAIGETTYYVYDAAGQRVRKVVERAAVSGETSARKSERLYLGGVEIYREYAPDGTTVALAVETVHVAAGASRIALVETKTIDTHESNDVNASLPRYQLTNHLGSSAIELDATGAVISYEESHPYGTTSYQAGRELTEVSRKRYRHAGKERDVETGLYYYGARYYAPWVGRWTAPDPAGFVDGPNLYCFARCSPTVLRDADGMQTSSSEGSVLAAVDATLDRKGVKYNTEVAVRIVTKDSAGRSVVIVRIYDRAFFEGDKLKLLEAKGKNLTRQQSIDQSIADAWVQKHGGKVEIIRVGGKPPKAHGTLPQKSLALSGSNYQIDPGDVEVVHGNRSPRAKNKLASNNMGVDAWKAGKESLPDAPSGPHDVRLTQPNKAPTTLTQDEALSIRDKNAGPPKATPEDALKHRPTKPPGGAQKLFKEMSDEGLGALGKFGTKKVLSIGPGLGFVGELALKEDDTSWGEAVVRGFGAEVGAGPVDATTGYDAATFGLGLTGGNDRIEQAGAAVADASGSPALGAAAAGGMAMVEGVSFIGNLTHPAGWLTIALQAR